ncbi:MAG: DUF177 domain-containing protein [Chloroflexi bacterium]|nr:DUF177 domain-containing protein [Chloroflexota bacterium]
MQVNVAQQLKEPIGSVRTYRLEETGDLPPDMPGHDYHGQIVCLKTDKGILVRVAAEAAYEGTCSRCLSTFESPLPIRLEEEFFPLLDILAGLPLSVPTDESFTIDEHHLLHLDEALRQYTWMSMPMKPLCQPDCAGLCPECGANLNQGSCGCPPRSRDQRWGALLERLESRSAF